MSPQAPLPDDDDVPTALFDRGAVADLAAEPPAAITEPGADAVAGSDPKLQARRALHLIAFTAAAAMVLGAIAGGHAANLAWNGVVYVMLAAVAVMARLDGQVRGARWISVALGLVAMAACTGGVAALATAVYGPTPDGGPARDPDALRAVSLTLWLAWVVSALVFVPPIARLVLPRLRLDPSRATHVIAVWLTVGLTLIFGAALAGGGAPILMRMVAQSTEPLAGTGPLDQLLSFLWVVPAVLVAAGLGTDRNWRETLDRLGIVRPDAIMIANSALIAATLVAVVVMIEPLLQSAVSALGLPLTDETAVEKLFSASMTPVGALVLAVTAGVGEEIAVRGLLQPRVGIIVSNLLFTALHALQYGVDGLLVVFGLGVCFGILRRRSNTVVCMIAHGLYDLFLVGILMSHG